MTLDEAITHAREVAEKNRRAMNFESEDNIDDDIKMNCLNCAEQHDQLAEWLEDYKRLKSIPQHTYDNCHNATCRRKCEKDGYDKAIDDFVKEVCRKYTVYERNGIYRFCCCEIKQDVADIGEQLKGGE